MSDVIALFHIKQSVGSGINDPEVIKDQSDSKKRANSIIMTSAISKDGKVLGEIDGNMAISMPIEQSATIRDIYDELKTQGFRITVGVGETTKEAHTAMNYAIDNSPQKIRVYTPEMDIASESAEPGTVAESTQDMPITKAEAEDEKKPIELDEKTKQELQEILSVVQNNKDYFEQLKGQQPDLYAAIADVIGSSAEMVQSVKEQQKVEENKQMEKIVNSLQKESNRNLDENEKEVIKELMSLQDKKEDEEKSKLSGLYNSFKENYLANHFKPSKPFLIHGSDNE